MILLIADSGSTTTDWAVVYNNTTLHIKTPGINPVHQDDTTIECTLSQGLCPQLKEIEPTHIYFYGAGCVGGEANMRLEKIFRAHYPQAHIAIESDLLGAARSLCQHTPGIAGILGTGANSCYYDGSAIVANIPPLGYILGDEGSGASLGKAFLKALLRNELGSELLNEFYTAYSTDYRTLITRIYREPAANRYLASLSPFIASQLDNVQVRRIVYDTFASFIDNHIMRYDYKNSPLHLTGSVAHYYKDVITQVAHDKGVEIGTITRTPIDGLITYHTNNI
ncbi:MAG: ATPase [Bacteroidaceae bacterium]|nr:ATPase [Bacteroidaceae bacterium]